METLLNRQDIMGLRFGLIFIYRIFKMPRCRKFTIRYQGVI